MKKVSILKIKNRNKFKNQKRDFFSGFFVHFNWVARYIDELNKMEGYKWIK